MALALELALGLLLHLYDGPAAALLLGCLADGRRAEEGGLHGGDGAGYQLRRGGTSRSGGIGCDRRQGIRWVGGRRGRGHGGGVAAAHRGGLRDTGKQRGFYVTGTFAVQPITENQFELLFLRASKCLDG